MYFFLKSGGGGGGIDFLFGEGGVCREANERIEKMCETNEY